MNTVQRRCHDEERYEENNDNVRSNNLIWRSVFNVKTWQNLIKIPLLQTPIPVIRSNWSMPKWWIFMNLPRAWMHSKMVIKQRRMETKPHGDSEMEEWRVSDWMVNAPLGYIPGATGISRSVASLPSTLHASSTAEIMWNAQAAWMPNPRNLSKNSPPSSFFPHAVFSKSIQ